MFSFNKPIAITPGEPGGIGPDIVLKLADQNFPTSFLIFADPAIFLHRANIHKLPIQVNSSYELLFNGKKTSFRLHPIQAAYPEILGHAHTANAVYVLETLKQAAHACLQGECAALVTGPVHKGIINEAGIAFSGHTEFLAHLAKVKHVVMMLVADTLRVALATTHLPLKKISKAITKKTLRQTLAILYESLQTQFAIKQPNILVCGLNPHAGEGGYLGDEEIKIIRPVIEEFDQKYPGQIQGPLPADTLFTPYQLNKADAVLAMYHDQGLPVLKYAGFGEAVNVTLGLPFIRTSVDHGTAFDQAGKNSANPSSLLAAIRLAVQLVRIKST